MEAKTISTAPRDHEIDGELAGILTAISIVSKRLAVKLTRLSQQGEPTKEGGNPDGQYAS